MRTNAFSLVVRLGLTAVGGKTAIPGSLDAPLLASEHDGQNDGRGECSVRRLRGVWSVLATGFVVTPPPSSGIPAGPFATVGTLTVDSGGHAVLNGTRSFNGTIVSEADLPGTIRIS
jgi:hypothetical protein